MTRAPIWLAPGVPFILAAGLMALAPQPALAGWRAAFIVLSGVPIGAVVLLLIARVTGADWDAALLPLTRPLPFLWLAVVPLIAGQALFVPLPDHLRVWLAWPFTALRSAAAIGWYVWFARALRRGILSETGAALGLVGHGIAVTLLAADWLLALHPGQPFSAAGMALAVLQILAACAAACLIGRGPPAMRRDLGLLLIAACLGFAYLLFMDFLVVWYGNQPQRVGWYLAQGIAPWALIAPLALLMGIACPILAIAIGGRWALPLAGAGALCGSALALAGETALPLAGMGLLLAALLGLAGAVWREQRA